MAKTRMRGTNPDGHSYDIPDVPWVMPFMGDYTFHGAPWRQAWGVPLSNGCVSMPTENAKFVYDWTPVGTSVNIHYFSPRGCHRLSDREGISWPFVGRSSRRSGASFVRCILSEW